MLKPAVEGGQPVRNNFLPPFRPAIGMEEIEEVVDTLKSDWITTGPKVKRFEEDVKKYTGAKHAIAVSSCTDALHLILVSLGIGRGDEVITTPFTFVATANVILWTGAKPVFVDVKKDTFNIDPSKIEGVITKNTKAIIAVHYAGQPCRMDEITEIAKKYNLAVIEDAAHAIGAKYKGKNVGTIGNFTAFSFYASKNLTTAEGGMVCLNDDELAEKIRILSLHGISRDAWKRYSFGGSWYYEVLHLGYKNNMTDIAASLGIHQLAKQEAFLEKKEKIAKMYDEAFLKIPEIILPAVIEDVRHARHLYPILINTELLKIDRAKFIEALTAENIGTSVHFIPVHLHPYYQKTFNFKKGDFPNAEFIFEREISLPIHSTMELKDAEDVILAVKKIINYFKKEREMVIGETRVGGKNPCFIVAEIGINFDGKYEQATAMIDAASKAGCNAVKFQMFASERMYPKKAGQYLTASGKKVDIVDVVKNAELPIEWIPALRNYAKTRGLEFFSSVCDEESADIMEPYCDVFKVTSYEITHIPLLRHIAKKGKPIIFSCGGATLPEIAKAMEIFREEGNHKITLLHCIGQYPAPLQGLNLNVISTLKTVFPQAIIGYSDHSSDPAAAPRAAVALGAKIIEKHITLDRNLPGPDHSFALDPAELKMMVETIRKTEEEMAEGKKVEINPILSGNFERETYDGERRVRNFAYRCLFAKSDIRKGDLLTKDNLAVLRPGENERGLNPEFFEVLINGYKATRDIPKNKSVTWDDVLER